MIKSAKYLICLTIMLRLVAKSLITEEDTYLCKKPAYIFDNPSNLVECVKIQTVDAGTTTYLEKRSTSYNDAGSEMRIYVPFRVFQKMYNDILKERERDENAPSLPSV